ncbi:MAG: hypothetical protein HW401_4 [Parcubacteria group bacterium]|nr:hypothetical protein [Parcubacteria group bacterium]
MTECMTKTQQNKAFVALCELVNSPEANDLLNIVAIDKTTTRFREFTHHWSLYLKNNGLFESDGNYPDDLRRIEPNKDLIEKYELTEKKIKQVLTMLKE